MTQAEPHNTGNPPPRQAVPFWRRHRRAMAVVKYSLLAGVLYYVGHALIVRFAEVHWSRLEVLPHYVLLSALVLMAMSVLGVVYFQMLLRAFCPSPAFLPMAAIAWIPRLGRYVPGKVASFAGVIWLLTKHDIPGPIAGSVSVLRQALGVITGLVVASPLILWTPVRKALPLASVWCPVLVLGGLVCLHPRVFGWASGWLLRKLRRPPLQKLPTLREYAAPAAMFTLIWLLSGVSMWFLTLAIEPCSPKHIPFLAATSAMAGVIGFLAFFAPGGLGVRDGIYLVLLGQIIKPEHAALVTVGNRLINTLLDALFAGAGLIILRLAKKKQVATAPAGPAVDRVPPGG